MAVSSRDINHAHRMDSGALSGHLRSLLYSVMTLLVLSMLSLGMGNVIGWGEMKWNDLRYGRPRTFHISANVGHGDAPGMPSHLVAMNLDRQVVVLDIPGGDVSQVRVLPGPYLFGEKEHLTPVTMRVDDMNGDTHVDLIVRIKDEEIIYLNHDGEFTLVSNEERQQILQQAGSYRQ